MVQKYGAVARSMVRTPWRVGHSADAQHDEPRQPMKARRPQSQRAELVGVAHYLRQGLKTGVTRPLTRAARFGMSTRAKTLRQFTSVRWGLLLRCSSHECRRSAQSISRGPLRKLQQLRDARRLCANSNRLEEGVKKLAARRASARPRVTSLSVIQGSKGFRTSAPERATSFTFRVASVNP